ncbi:hypothetical protein HK102_000434, partial [Quaeritorhiza haematococci]
MATFKMSKSRKGALSAASILLIPSLLPVLSHINPVDASTVQPLTLQDEFNPFFSSARLQKLLDVPNNNAVSTSSNSGRSRLTAGINFNGGTIASAPDVNCRRRHKVAEGDSCWDIAQREEYKSLTVPLDFQRMKLLNPTQCREGAIIFANQELCVDAPVPSNCNETVAVEVDLTTCADFIKKIISSHADSAPTPDVFEAPENQDKILAAGIALQTLNSIEDHLVDCNALNMGKLLCISTKESGSLIPQLSKNGTALIDGPVEANTTAEIPQTDGLNATNLTNSNTTLTNVTLPLNATLFANATASLNSTASANATQTPEPSPTTTTTAPTPTEPPTENNNNNNNGNNDNNNGGGNEGNS